MAVQWPEASQPAAPEDTREVLTIRISRGMVERWVECRAWRLVRAHDGTYRIAYSKSPMCRRCHAPHPEGECPRSAMADEIWRRT